MLGLANPKLKAPPQRLIVVLDASASMAAGRRWEEAQARAAALLRRTPRAVVVRAGLHPEVRGPAPGKDLLRAVRAWRPGDAGTDVAAALAAASRALPGAPVAWIGDADPGPPAAFYPVGGKEENAGITRLAEDFLVLGHTGKGPVRRRVRVDGKVLEVRLPARGFRTLSLPPAPSHEVRLLEKDALTLDDQSAYLRARPAVAVKLQDPALFRLLTILGARVGTRGDLAVQAGTPTEPPPVPTLFFAKAAEGEAVVVDREAGHPLLLGTELLGERLPLPPPPGPGFAPLAVDSAGRGLVYSDGKSLYLPPLRALADRPFFPVLVYNFLAPHLRAAKPLGTDGVRAPRIRGGVAYVLEAPEETLLRPPPKPRPLAEGERLLGPLLWLAAAALVLLDSRLR